MKPLILQDFWDILTFSPIFSVQRAIYLFTCKALCVIYKIYIYLYKQYICKNVRTPLKSPYRIRIQVTHLCSHLIKKVGILAFVALKSVIFFNLLPEKDRLFPHSPQDYQLETPEA